MIDLQEIVAAIDADRVVVTRHAQIEAANDRLTVEEVVSTIRRGEIIKQYPDDRPYPSCLILSYTMTDDPLHSVWAYNGDTGSAVFVTVYRPDPNLWIDWRAKRP